MYIYYFCTHSICGYVLFKVFRRLLRRVLVCPAQMEQLKRVEKVTTQRDKVVDNNQLFQDNLPIIYLPLHRSHLDYLLITWTSWHWNLQLPHIASGDNLNLSGFGYSLIRHVLM